MKKLCFECARGARFAIFRPARLSHFKNTSTRTETEREGEEGGKRQRTRRVCSVDDKFALALRPGETDGLVLFRSRANGAIVKHFAFLLSPDVERSFLFVTPANRAAFNTT